MSEDYFHLKCQIFRKGSDYGINRETFTSTMHLVLARADAEFLFIGSAPKSHIHIKGIESQQASLMLSNEQITVEALAPFELLTKKGEQRKQLNAKERIRLTLVNRAKWEIVFPNQSSLKCTIYDEMHCVPKDLVDRLETQYGKLEKIWESQTFFTFKTEDGKVLKVLHPNHAKNKKIATRFEKAAKSFQKLPEDKFVKINKVINDDERKFCYVEMDYLEGELLGNYMTKKGIVPLDEAENIVKEIARTLVNLQERGFTVRNLHPYNILLCNDSTLRIMGFFLLKDYSLHMTQENDQMVVPNYTSPEQLQNPSLVDVYSDIYSLGVIFYSLLLGEAPIGGNSINEYVFLLSSAEPISADEIKKRGPDIPYETCKLLAAMLSFDKGQRPAPRQVLSTLSGEGPPVPGKAKNTGFFHKLLKMFGLG